MGKKRKRRRMVDEGLIKDYIIKKQAQIRTTQISKDLSISEGTCSRINRAIFQALGHLQSGRCQSWKYDSLLSKDLGDEAINNIVKKAMAIHSGKAEFLPAKIESPESEETEPTRDAAEIMDILDGEPDETILTELSLDDLKKLVYSQCTKALAEMTLTYEKLFYKAAVKAVRDVAAERQALRQRRRKL